jgi:hypothetical protein
MDYYLCNKANAPQLSDTQANAAKLDKKFEKISIDTAKHPLMGMLNLLLAGNHPLQLGQPGGSPVPAQAELRDPAEPAGPAEKPKLIAPQRETTCPVCHRTPLAAENMVEHEVLADIEDFISEKINPDNMELLERIEESIAIRRGQLATSIPAGCPSPPKRRRSK